MSREEVQAPVLQLLLWEREGTDGTTDCPGMVKLKEEEHVGEVGISR